MSCSKIFIASALALPLILSGCSSKTSTGSSSNNGNTTGLLSVSTTKLMPVTAVPGTSTTWSYTLTNKSTGTISDLVESGFSGPISHQEQLSSYAAALPSCSSTTELQPGQSCSYSLTYQPSSSSDAPSNESFKVSYDRLSSNGTNTLLHSKPLAISENAYKAALAATASPNPVAAPLDNTATWSLNLQNTSTQQGISNISLNGLANTMKVVNNPCATIPAQSTCTMTLSFSPTSSSDAGSHMLTLQYVEAGKQLSTQTQVITKIGTQALTLSKSQVTLSSKENSSDTSAITLSDNSHSAITNVKTSGLSAPFSLVHKSSNDCPTTAFDFPLSNGQYSCNLDIQYTPKTPAAGTLPAPVNPQTLLINYTQQPEPNSLMVLVNAHISYNDSVNTSSSTIAAPAQTGNKSTSFNIPINIPADYYPITISSNVLTQTGEASLGNGFNIDSSKATGSNGYCKIPTGSNTTILNSTCNIPVVYTPPVSTNDTTTPQTHDFQINFNNGDPSKSKGSTLPLTVTTSVSSLSWKDSCTPAVPAEMSGYTIAANLKQTATCTYTVSNHTGNTVTLAHLGSYLPLNGALQITSDSCSGQPLNNTKSCSFTLNYKPTEYTEIKPTKSFNLIASGTDPDNVISIQAGVLPTAITPPPDAAINAQVGASTPTEVLVPLKPSNTGGQQITIPSSIVATPMQNHLSGLQFGGATSKASGAFPGTFPNVKVCGTTGANANECLCPTGKPMPTTGCDMALQYSTSKPLTTPINQTITLSGYSDTYSNSKSVSFPIKISTHTGSVSIKLNTTSVSSSLNPTTAPTVTLTVSNASSSSISLSNSPALNFTDGVANTSNFTLLSNADNACGKTLAAGSPSTPSTCTYTYQFKPTTVASSITTNAGTVSFKLTYGIVGGGNNQTNSVSVNTSISEGALTFAPVVNNGLLNAMPKTASAFLIKVTPTANDFPPTLNALSAKASVSADSIAYSSGQYPGFAGDSTHPACPSSGGKPSAITTACYLEFSYTANTFPTPANSSITFTPSASNTDPATVPTFKLNVISAALLAATDNGLYELNPSDLTTTPKLLWGGNLGSGDVKTFTTAFNQKTGDIYIASNLNPPNSTSGSNYTLVKLNLLTGATSNITITGLSKGDYIRSIAVLPQNSGAPILGLVAYQNTTGSNTAQLGSATIAIPNSDGSSYTAKSGYLALHGQNIPFAHTITSVVDLNNQLVFTNDYDNPNTSGNNVFFAPAYTCSTTDGSCEVLTYGTEHTGDPDGNSYVVLNAQNLYGNSLQFLDSEIGISNSYQLIAGSPHWMQAAVSSNKLAGISIQKEATGISAEYPDSVTGLGDTLYFDTATLQIGKYQNYPSLSITPNMGFYRYNYSATAPQVSGPYLKNDYIYHLDFIH